MKNKSAQLVLLTIGMRGVWGVWKAFSRKFLKPLLIYSLVDVGGLHNSCNPQPAQRLTMLKNCSVILYFFQMALKTPQTPQIGACYD